MNTDKKSLLAPAKPSSTIVVMRDANPQAEMLMIKRRAGDAFGESYAFPGGVVDDDESAACDLGLGIAADEANAILNVNEGGLCYYSAGIRELFEETGVLLARDKSGDWARCGTEFEEFRRKVDNGSLAWPEFLRQQGLRMACDSLHYFAHWETPFSLPKRWTTRFFLAVLPAGQSACHDGIETTDSRWTRASDALSHRKKGLIDMPYPTVKTLESLRRFQSVADVLAWTNEEQRRGIRKNRPGKPPSEDQF